MPGISVCRTDEEGDESPREALERSVRPTYRDDRYVWRVAYEGSSVVVGYMAYPSYPVRVIERDDHAFVLEGHVYDWAESEVPDRLDALFAETEGFTDEATLGSWVAAVDGEFVICAVDRRSEDVTVVTDCLGRLPLYRGTSGNRRVLSRQHRVVVEALASPESGSGSGLPSELEPKSGSEPLKPASTSKPTFDRLGVAQTLLFGYTLGRRTMIEGVRSLPPAARIVIDGDGIDVTRLHSFDFESKAHRDRSLDENVAELVKRFVEACRARASRGRATASEGQGSMGRGEMTNLLSLSGGLDSRAILAAFADADLPCATATMDHGAVAESDVTIAGDLAREFGVDWHCYDVPEANGEVFRTHVRAADGRDPLSIAYIHGFFERLVTEHGAITYFAGDGGDKTLPDITPGRRIESTDALVEHTIESNRRFSLVEAAAIAGVSEEALVRSVRERFDRYPETGSDGLYAHFLVHERARNWLFPSEDTNRCYAWSPSPFYSLPFFQYATNCPDEQKRYYRLYGAFLAELSPAAAGMANANFGVAPDSPLHTAAALTYETMQRYPEVFERLKPLLARAVGFDSAETDGSDSTPGVYTRVQLDDGGRIERALSVPALRAWLESDRSDGARFEAYLLATVVAYATELDSGATEDAGDAEGSESRLPAE